MSFKEIATILDISEERAEQIYKQAMRKLKKIMPHSTLESLKEISKN